MLEGPEIWEVSIHSARKLENRVDRKKHGRIEGETQVKALQEVHELKGEKELMKHLLLLLYLSQGQMANWWA